MIKVVAGNWKMHLGPEEAAAYFERFHPTLPEDASVQLLFFPPALSLAASVAATERIEGIGLGVQNIHYEGSGAFTGEISAPMAREAGATHALVGHSERRHIFGETDDEVRRKTAAAGAADLVPVVCVGETLDERRSGLVAEVIDRQLSAALEGLEDDRFMVAYEPVWAIGTGETATPGDASAAHATLRRRLETWDADRGRGVPILYGGSVKPGNAFELLTATDVDGVLVGGASLDPESFAAIAEAGTRAADEAGP